MRVLGLVIIKQEKMDKLLKENRELRQEAIAAHSKKELCKENAKKTYDRFYTKIRTTIKYIESVKGTARMSSEKDKIINFLTLK